MNEQSIINPEIYDIIEVPTVFGYSIVGKLVSEEGNKIIIKEPLILAPVPQGFNLRPVSNLAFLEEMSISKDNIFGYVKISDTNFIKKYEDTVLKIKGAFSGLELDITDKANIKKFPPISN